MLEPTVWRDEPQPPAKPAKPWASGTLAILTLALALSRLSTTCLAGHFFLLSTMLKLSLQILIAGSLPA